MKIFVLEYASAYGIKELIEEGRLMKKLITSGLNKGGFEVIEIEDSYENTREDTCEGTGKAKYSPKNIKGSIKKEIKEKCEEADRVILIAPNREMLELSEIIPENKLLASNPDALEVCCNKFKTYYALKDKVKMPETEIYRKIYSEFFPGKSDENIKSLTSDENIKYPFVVKHIYGSGCENLHFIKDKREFDKIKRKLDENYIVQEYVNGVHASVSLLCGEEPFPISLNLQFIDLKLKPEYLGCLVPYEHNLKEKAFKAAKKASEFLNLRGYIGMDFVLGDDAYLIEINPRITTSAAAINLSGGANIAVLHVNCFERNIRGDVEKIKFLKNVMLRKA